MSGIGVVTNPLSRRNRRNPRLMDRLAYILGDKGDLAQPRDWAGMEDVARSFLDRQIDVLCINGGDGTGHVVLSAMARVYGDHPLPMVALLRGGTMNTVAHALGIRGSPSTLLDRVVNRYQAGTPFRCVERNLLCVDGKHYGFLFGNGVAATWLQVYYEGEEPSPTKGVKVFARTILAMLFGGPLARRLVDLVKAQVTLDGHVMPVTRFLTVAAGTSDDLGFGFRPFWAAPSNPDHFHALGFACSPLALAMELPRMRLARPLRNPDIYSRVGHLMRIEANRPIHYMVDGDFHQGGQVLEVTVGPRLRMVVG